MLSDSSVGKKLRRDGEVLWTQISRAEFPTFSACLTVTEYIVK